MNGLNKVQLIGTVGSDPETKIINENLRVSSFRIATNDSYLEKSTGQRKDTTEWHNVEAWNVMSDTVANYFKKGTHVYVEGKIKTDCFEDKDGGKKIYRTKIVMESFLFVGKKIDEQGQSQPVQQPTYAQPVQQHTYAQPVQQPTYAQPVQQPTYAQPVQQPTYAQPVQQPTYAQPVQQPTYAQPVVQQPMNNSKTDSQYTSEQFINSMTASDDLPF